MTQERTIKIKVRDLREGDFFRLPCGTHIYQFEDFCGVSLYYNIGTLFAKKDNGGTFERRVVPGKVVHYYPDKTTF